MTVVILSVSGLPAPVELRWAPEVAGAIGGYDPIDLTVNSVEDCRSGSITSTVSAPTIRR
jgi:hypothetical protein